MTSDTATTRALIRARPRPDRLGWPERIRAVRARLERRSFAWLGGYLAGLAVATWWAVRDPSPYSYVLGAYLISGAQAGAIYAWLSLDVYRRRVRLDRSGLVAVAGFRIVAPVSDVDPNLLLAVSLLSYVFDNARLARVPVRGHRRRTRITYQVSLRALAREWGRGCGISGRRADALLVALCDQFGVVRRVPVGTTVAYRLVDESIGSALAHLEQSANANLIAWSLGRDPEWDLRPTKGYGPV